MIGNSAEPLLGRELRLMPLGRPDTASTDYHTFSSRAPEENMPWTITVDVASEDIADVRRRVLDWYAKSLELTDEWLEREFLSVSVKLQAPSRVVLVEEQEAAGELKGSNFRPRVSDAYLSVQTPSWEAWRRRWSTSSATWETRRWFQDVVASLVAMQGERALRRGSSSVVLGEREIEPLSETLWIQVGEVRSAFEELLQCPVYLYMTSDGGFIIDAIWRDGRVACVIRKSYVHLMMLKDGKMIDELVEGKEASTKSAVHMLIKHLV